MNKKTQQINGKRKSTLFACFFFFFRVMEVNVEQGFETEKIYVKNCKEKEGTC